MAQTLYPHNSSENPMVVTFNQRAAAAVPTTSIFTAPYACTVATGTFVYGTAAGAASTVNLFKDTGTTAPGGGTAIAAAIDMNSTTNTLNSLVLTAGALMAAGDRLSLKVASGTATGTADFQVTLTISRV